MVDLCHPMTQFYTLPPGYRDENEPAHTASTDDLPLNLSLRSEREVHYESAQYVEEVVTQPFVGEESFIAQPSDGDLGNVVILSDLDCAVAQEEVVIAEEDVYTAEEGDEAADSVDLGHAEILLTQETARNTLLKAKEESLYKQIAAVRQLLTAEAQKEKDAGGYPEPDLDVKSEGESEGADRPTDVSASKRSRNHSWPQMTATTSNQRKKEQNKMASKRFRERKKQELLRAKQEIVELEGRNSQLKIKVEAMQSEADAFKKILLRLKLIRIVDLPTGQSTIVKI